MHRFQWSRPENQQLWFASKHPPVVVGKPGPQWNSPEMLYLDRILCTWRCWEEEHNQDGQHSCMSGLPCKGKGPKWEPGCLSPIPNKLCPSCYVVVLSSLLPGSVSVFILLMLALLKIRNISLNKEDKNVVLSNKCKFLVNSALGRFRYVTKNQSAS